MLQLRHVSTALARAARPAAGGQSGTVAATLNHFAGLSWRAASSSSPPQGGGGAPPPGGGQSGPSGGSSAGPDWRSDKEKYWHIHMLPGGRQPRYDLSVGPYHHTFKKDPKTGKLTLVGHFFVSPKKDPVTFVTNTLIVMVTIWTISQLSWGESFFEKRRRVIREKIRQEYGLPKGWDHEIEEDGELELAEIAPTVSVASSAAKNT